MIESKGTVNTARTATDVQSRLRWQLFVEQDYSQKPSLSSVVGVVVVVVVLVEEEIQQLSREMRKVKEGRKEVEIDRRSHRPEPE